MKRDSACPRSVDTGGSFLIIGPASMTRLCIGLGVLVAILVVNVVEDALFGGVDFSNIPFLPKSVNTSDVQIV